MDDVLKQKIDRQGFFMYTIVTFNRFAFLAAPFIENYLQSLLITVETGKKLCTNPRTMQHLSNDTEVIV